MGAESSEFQRNTGNNQQLSFSIRQTESFTWPVNKQIASQVKITEIIFGNLDPRSDWIKIADRYRSAPCYELLPPF
jgi:hypothetical protein